MNYNEATEYINAAGLLGSKPGLKRIEKLCRLLGDPQEKTRFVHIAGTNGKGSTAAMISGILTAAGYKTGLYTSPHLCFFEERISVGGAPIGKNRLADIIGRIKECADKMSDKPTEFEIATAAAFLYFCEEKCDIAVLETGLGGRLDATNIIKKPLLSVITGIDLDHTAILGGTTDKIAYEKGGIIKPRRPVVLADCKAKAGAVISEIAKENRAPLIKADYSRQKNISVSLDGTAFDFKPYGKIKLSLSGVYQAHNAAVALTAAEALKGEGFAITENDIKSGLARARWPARFEVLSNNPLIIYDGAHNPQGAQALKENLAAVGIKKAVFLSGVMADKDYLNFAKTLAPLAETAFTAAAESSRALAPEKLAAVFGEYGVKATPYKTVREGAAAAIGYAKKENLPLIICGSLYIYKEVTEALKEVFSFENGK